MKPNQLLPIIIAVVLTLWATRIPDEIPQFVSVVPIIGAWLAVLLRFVPALAKPINLLRRVPALLWLIILVLCIGMVGAWMIVFQPAAGITITLTEIFWFIGTIYSLAAITSTGEKPDDMKLGWLGGVLVTLTTLVLIVVGIEIGLRYFVVMSDNFQFSKMHRNWSRLYWKPLNEIGEGYRDYPPAPNDERTQIIVAGDSLAAGYGVNSIDDTFPHVLDNLLGDDYTVNIVAQPGWGISTALGSMQSYPTQAEIIVLSHYINDVVEGPAGQQYNQPFPSIRLDPPDNQRWWVENFYIANFLYYRVFLYTQHDSVGLYNEWLRGAYENPAVWQAYENEMQAWIDYTRENDAQLVVIVWPNLLDIDAWRDVINPVVDYFETHNIPVIDMGEVLEDESPAKLIVNPFDAHPSEYAHRVAAEALYGLVEVSP